MKVRILFISPGLENGFDFFSIVAFGPPCIVEKSVDNYPITFKIQEIFASDLVSFCLKISSYIQMFMSSEQDPLDRRGTKK